MKAIVVVDKNWGIGKNNALLFRLPPDMARFKKETMGNVIVMGGNTMRSFPDGKPLPGRTNIVLSKSLPDGNYIRVNSLDELKTTLAKYDSDKIFIVGGASFYATMLSYCDEILVTKVNADGGATVFFPNLDRMTDFVLTHNGEEKSYEGLKYSFCVYTNRNPIKFTA